jgi:RNA-binding protein YlmH
MKREELLKRVENKAEISRVIDQAEQAIKNWEIVVTDFFSPPVLAEVESLLQNLTDLGVAILKQKDSELPYLAPIFL